MSTCLTQATINLGSQGSLTGQVASQWAWFQIFVQSLVRQVLAESQPDESKFALKLVNFGLVDFFVLKS